MCLLTNNPVLLLPTVVLCNDLVSSTQAPGWSLSAVLTDSTGDLMQSLTFLLFYLFIK